MLSAAPRETVLVDSKTLVTWYDGHPRRIVLVKTHDDIDRRSLMMARCIVARIDNDPAREGLEHARQVCARWVSQGNVPAKEWMVILERPWSEIRTILLGDSEEGTRLRQSDPFCGILTPVERWEIYREAARAARAAGETPAIG